MPHWRAAALVLTDAAVVSVLQPDWATVIPHLRSPRTWLATEGMDGVSGDLAMSALWLLSLWLALGILLSTLSHLPGAGGRVCAVAVRLTLPRWARRYLVTLTGVTLVFAPLESSLAAAMTAPPSAAVAVAVVTQDVSTTEHPDTTDTPGWPMTPAASPPEAPQDEATVTVRPGDSLWLIAARHNFAAADQAPPSQADIAAECQRWYAANMATIGKDPDLIRPGLHLHAPPPSMASATQHNPGEGERHLSARSN